MTKQQLTRLFIVIAAAAAIVFVPYWLCNFIAPYRDFKSDVANIIMTWLLGTLSIGVSFLVGGILVFGIIIPTIDYINDGK